MTHDDRNQGETPKKMIESLPDRPLDFDEFRELQHEIESEHDGMLYSGDTPGRGDDVLIIDLGHTEYTIHYTDDLGWHHCSEADD